MSRLALWSPTRSHSRPSSLAAKDALEREVYALERAMKRPRNEASSTQNAEGMKVDEYMRDLGHHRREATRVRNLCNIERLAASETLAKKLLKMKPDKWGFVQASQLWYVHRCIQKKEEERGEEQEKKSERERKTEKV